MNGGSRSRRCQPCRWEAVSGLRRVDGSPQHSRFLQQLLQRGLTLDGAIQCSLECLPQGLVQCEMATVCQGLGGCRDAGVEQELADVLVAGTGSFLQQLLDGCAGTNVDAFGLGTVAGTHRSSRKGGFGILRLWLSGQCPDNAPRSGRTQGGCPRKSPTGMSDRAWDAGGAGGNRTRVRKSSATSSTCVVTSLRSRCRYADAQAQPATSHLSFRP